MSNDSLRSLNTPIPYVQALIGAKSSTKSSDSLPEPEEHVYGFTRQRVLEDLNKRMVPKLDELVKNLTPTNLRESLGLFSIGVSHLSPVKDPAELRATVNRITLPALEFDERGDGRHPARYCQPLPIYVILWILGKFGKGI